MKATNSTEKWIKAKEYKINRLDILGEIGTRTNSISRSDTQIKTLIHSQASNTRSSPHFRVMRFIRVIFRFISNALSWLNHLGNSEIDIKSIEPQTDYHIGLRKLNL